MSTDGDEMSTDDDKRAVERFVAGLHVPPDDIAEAIAARAIDRTLANESLLLGLADDEAIVRIRSARRIARMDGVAPGIEAQLRLMAATDVDLRTRRACGEALRAHGRAESGQGVAPATASSPEAAGRAVARGRAVAGLSLWLRARVPRVGEVPRSDDSAEVSFVARDRSVAPGVGCRIVVVRDAAVLHMTNLPIAFAGAQLTATVHHPASAEPVAIVTAALAVTEDGSATIDLSAATGTIAGADDWKTVAIELTAGPGGGDAKRS